MRNVVDEGMAAALALAIIHGKRRLRPEEPRVLTEVERWNAEVEAKRAAKKARKLAGKEPGNG